MGGCIGAVGSGHGDSAGGGGGEGNGRGFTDGGVGGCDGSEGSGGDDGENTDNVGASITAKLLTVNLFSSLRDCDIVHVGVDMRVTNVFHLEKQ